MKINDLITVIEGKRLTENLENVDIENVYICDLLSWVMSHAQKGDAWITVLTNVNVSAVAMMVDVACVIIPEGIEVEDITIKRANENGIIIISTALSSFEVCKKAITLM